MNYEQQQTAASGLQNQAGENLHISDRKNNECSKF